MGSGSLTLISTPLNPEHPIHPHNLKLIQKVISHNGLILIEDAKATRKRWTSWGLDRSYIENLIEFNEHTQDQIAGDILIQISKGKDAILLSDEGLPAFCDPGTGLVDMCHTKGIKVTSGVFDNSLVLALALSGYDSTNFSFLGFPPREKSERAVFMQEFVKRQGCVVLMDTAYRLERVLSEIKELDSVGEYCVAAELNREQEVVKRGKSSELYKAFAGSKKDFILVKKPCAKHRKKKK